MSKKAEGSGSSPDLTIIEQFEEFAWEKNGLEGPEDVVDTALEDKEKKEEPAKKPEKEAAEGKDDSFVDEDAVAKAKRKEAEAKEEEIDVQEETVQSFFDVISEKLGLPDFGEEFEKPKSIEDLTDFFDAYIEENSKPDYSSDMVKRLDDYIKNGGDFESFYKIQKEVISYDSMDLEDESNQKQVVSDYLELSGYDANQIAKKVKKYEETGILKDEAEDALESVKKIKEKETKVLEAQQAANKKEAARQEKAMFDSVLATIKDVKEIAGVPVKEADKKGLVDYMFRIQPNGRTKWQEEYGKDLLNVVQSAFFSMKGSSVISSAKKTGETDAVSRFKKAMASTKVNGTKGAAKTGDVDDFIAAFGI
jgi:hypothetical protein